MVKLRKIEIDVAVHSVIEASRSSFDESENEILRRLLGIDGMASSKPVHTPASSRNRGEWQWKCFEKSDDAPNMKAAYLAVVQAIAEEHTEFFELFSGQRFRSRFAIARNPESLYVNSPHLAEDHATQLSNGWYVDTNLSESQVSVRVRMACSLLKIKYGRDVAILRGGKKI